LDKKVTLKVLISGIFYLFGLLIFVYICVQVLGGNSIFDIEGLINCGILFCVPLSISTLLLMLSIKESEKRYKIMRVFVLAIFVFYIMALIIILFLNGYRQFRVRSTMSISEYLEHMRWSINLVPFRTIGMFVRSFINNRMNRNFFIENIVGNVVLFAPMGFLLPCIFKKLRKFILFLFVILLIPICVEILQLLTYCGSCDIDDVILNFTGAILSFGIWNVKPIQRLMRKAYIIK
jgi:glycopeptide antibiotics resistance protein